MPDGVQVRINLPDFKRQLAQFDQKIRKRIAGKALLAGGKVFQKEARRRAPVLQKLLAKGRTPGTLKRNIVVLRSRIRRANLVQYNVGVRTSSKVSRGKRAAFIAKGDPFYWYFLEGGWIPSGPRKRGGGRASASLLRRRAAGSGARRYRFPFLAPSFQSLKSTALNEINKVMEVEIAKESARVR